MKQSDNQTDKQSDNQKKNDFSRGSVVGNIMKLAVPMTLAQLINVLYNIVDRIYIGMIPENATLSLTGLGLCLPIISIVIAFANLFGMGGAPLCSIERGRGNEKEAEAIMGNSFVMMVAVGILLTVLGLMFKRPMLYLFGASDATIPYADAYVTIYLMGNIFVMTGLGMNSFINSQGFGTVGMMTVLLGAVTNIVLDPVFIFVFHMGGKGRCPGHHSFTDAVGPMDSGLPHRQAHHTEAAAFGHEAGRRPAASHRGPGNVRIYHVHHKQSCTDYV